MSVDQATFFQKLHKAELHLHLDGSVRPSTVLELAKEKGLELGNLSIETIRNMMSVNESVTSLVEYLTRFDHPLSVMQDAASLERISREVVEDCATDNVRYVEVRFAPRLHTTAGLTPSEAIAAVWAGMESAMASHTVVGRLIICGMRFHTESEVYDMARTAKECRQYGVVAFDMAGSEDGLISQNFPQLVSLVRETPGLSLTLHSGEAAGADSVRDSMTVCLADRLGHGVRMVEDPDLIPVAARQGTIMEMCPTSNLQTKAVENMEAFPIGRYRAAGIRTTICTDNKTVSDVTLSGEYELVHKTSGLSLVEMAQLAVESFRHAFVEEEVKGKLAAAAELNAIELLKQAGVDVNTLTEE